MTAFTPVTPEPGWERRWVREAFGLICATPHVILILISTGMLLGWSVSFTGRLSILVGVILCFVSAPVVAWSFFALGKHEGYSEGRFAGSDEAAILMIPTIIVITPLALLFMLVGDAPEVDTRSQRLSETVKWAVNILVWPIMFSLAGPFRQLTIGMVGAGPAQNRIIAVQAYDKLKSVFPKFTLILVALWCITIPMPDPVRMGFPIFCIYWVYVAGREIIGGITGNRKPQEAREALPSAA